MTIEMKMAWRNIWRNPRRTILTICAIAFASLLLVFMLSFQFGCYETMINSSVKISTGHMKVLAKGYLDDRNMRLAINDPEAVTKAFDTITGIESWSLRAAGFSLVSSDERTYGVFVTGIDPEKEATVSTIKSLIRKGSYLSAGDSYQAVVGELLATNLRVTVGDELTLIGQGRDGSVAAAVITVKGIFESGVDEVDRNALMIGLTDFKEIYSMRGGVHEAVITVDNLSNVAVVKGQVASLLKTETKEAQLEVADWMEIMPGLLQSIQMDLVSGIIMYFILVIVVAFSIFNTFVMAIFERTKEFGVMMAIGTTPGRLTRLVMYESTFMTMVGIGLGILAGSLLTLWFQYYGISIVGAENMMSQYGLPSRLYPKLSVISATSGPMVVCIITLISAVFPALKIRKLKPVEAMTHN